MRADVARMLQCYPWEAHALMRTGGLPAEKIDGYWMVSAAAVDAYLKDLVAQPAASASREPMWSDE
jgi:hypothetical protein